MFGMDAITFSIIFLGVLLFPPIACAIIARNKGRSGILWFILGLVFNFIGLIVIACLGKVEKLGRDLKKCPYCAELVQKDALVCKHCGRDISDVIELKEKA